MARTFRRHRQAHAISDLNITNLVDLAFVLLIVFMIATPLIQQEQTIPVNLPTESKSDQQKPDKDAKFVSISIDAKGNYFLADAPISFAELSNRLRGFSEDKTPPVIRIRADGQVNYQRVITLVDELKKNNLSKITFDTQAQ